MKIYSILFLFVIFLSFNLNFVECLSVSTHIPEKYLEIYPEDKVYFGIEISYPENFERKDLNLIYTILDSEGNIILKQEILRAIQNQAVLFDYLILPSTTKKGTYTLQIEINDNKSNINTKSSTTFLVLDKPLSEIKKYFFILFIAILFVAILVIIDILKG